MSIHIVQEKAKCKEECKDLEHQMQNLNSRLKESTEKNGELQTNLTHWAEKNAVIGQKADAAQGALDAVERRFLGSIAVIFILFVLYQQVAIPLFSCSPSSFIPLFNFFNFLNFLIFLYRHPAKPAPTKLNTKK